MNINWRVWKKSPLNFKPVLFPTHLLDFDQGASGRKSQMLPLGLSFLIAQLVKNLPEKQEMWVHFLGREDPLEREMAISQVFLPGESYGQRSLAGYSPWGHKSQT